MKYCMEFYVGGDYMKDADELIILTSENHNYGEFIKKRPNQRIIIRVMDEEDILDNKNLLKIFIALKQELNLDNFAVMLPQTCEQEKYIAPLKEAGIDYFFFNLADSWIKLRYLIQLGVSDVYITEALGFDLERASDFAHKNGAKVRTYPNVAQEEIPIYDIYSFFIRPEDIPIYENYIDVCEFFWKTKISEQPVYYKIYAIDKKWFGELQEIIVGLKQSIDSRYIVKQFAETRCHCKQRCLSGGTCRMCDRVLDLAGTLKKVGIIIDNSKKPNKHGFTEKEQAVIESFEKAREAKEDFEEVSLTTRSNELIDNSQKI